MTSTGNRSNEWNGRRQAASVGTLLLAAAIAVITASCNTHRAGAPEAGRTPTSIVNNPHTASGLDTAIAATKPVLTFKDTLHNFGNIHPDEVVQYDFAFINDGKSPLLITSAYGSCGCTVPDFPRDEIAPGKSGVIKVTFNSAGKSGHQEKTVTVHTNTVRGIHQLFIKADIEKK